MDFPHVNAIPHASATSEAVPQLRPVTPVEPVMRLDNQDAGRMDRDTSFGARLPQSRTGELEFRVDENTDRLVVSIYNDQGDVVRQIPAEVVLKMAQQITEVLDAQKTPTADAVAAYTNAGGAA